MAVHGRAIVHHMQLGNRQQIQTIESNCITFTPHDKKLNYKKTQFLFCSIKLIQPYLNSKITDTKFLVAVFLYFCNCFLLQFFAPFCQLTLGRAFFNGFLTPFTIFYEFFTISVICISPFIVFISVSGTFKCHF